MRSVDIWKAHRRRLVYIGVREPVEQNLIKKIRTISPTIMKPKVLWTGKHFVIIIKNIVISGMTYKQRKRFEKICGLDFD